MLQVPMPIPLGQVQREKGEAGIEIEAVSIVPLIPLTSKCLHTSSQMPLVWRIGHRNLTDCLDWLEAQGVSGDEAIARIKDVQRSLVGGAL